MSDKVSIGVFLCECGDKIAGGLDVGALVRHAGELPGVTWAGQVGYWCLPGGIERMRSVIAEHGLERVVIAGCTPRTHGQLFRRALDDAVDPTLISVINLRDLCALPHADDPVAATAKAYDQIAMAVAELAARQVRAPRVARITPRAVVIGGGIAGMTAALAISDAGIPVTLVERETELGGLAHLQSSDHQTAALVVERIAAIRARDAQHIQVATNATPTNVSGTVGQYRVELSNDQVVEVGAIIVATGAQPKSQIPNFNSHHYVFVLCDMTPEKTQTCLHACCLTTIRQATEIKRESPDADATIFFRELYTACGTYDDLVWEAQQAGVKFVRYPSGQVPQPVNGAIATYDELTGREVRVLCDRVIAAAPMTPQDDAAQLAAMLRLPIDANGFMADTRIRLRPADRIERGIYVCGAAHFPCDTEHAMFQAYDVAARAVRHIQRGEIVNWAPAATIDAARCNGCGDCARVCPFTAIVLTRRHGDKETGRPGDSESRLAVIDSLLCTGCGNCVSVCPVKAAQVASASDEQIEAQIRAALSGQGDKERGRQGDREKGREEKGLSVSQSPGLPVLIFACEWSGYSAAEIAGAQQLAYPASTRVIRVNCTGRLQPGLLLKALEMGAAGVMVLGCAPGVCHYEQGSERAAAVFEQASALGHLMGLDKRFALKWIPPDDGATFVQVVKDFVAGIKRKT